MPSRARPTEPGWASHWADESLKLAAKAYADLSFGAVTLNTDPSKDFKIDRIAITFSPDYNDNYKQVVAQRMIQSALVPQMSSTKRLSSACP